VPLNVGSEAEQLSSGSVHLHVAFWLYQLRFLRKERLGWVAVGLCQLVMLSQLGLGMPCHSSYLLGGAFSVAEAVHHHIHTVEVEHCKREAWYFVP
jgi:hypothetical protein